jgi:hypothetical protein
MHPILVAALAEDRHRRCPCGAVAQRPHRPCRNCRHGHYLKLQHSAAAPMRRFPLSASQIRRALSFARLLSLLQSTSKGTKG